MIEDEMTHMRRHGNTNTALYQPSMTLVSR